MGRAPCCEKVGLKKGRWTAEEDDKLTKYIQENGEGSWRSLPKNAGLLRCGKSCRLRWINYLRADLKRGNITTEEEEIIIKLHSSYGNRWSMIAGHLPGRTDNEIKNYWNSHLSRRIHSFKRPNDELPVIMDMGKIAGGPRRKGGKASKSKKDNNATHVENRREKENDSDRSIPSIPLKEKEASSEISVQHEGVDPQHDNGVGVVHGESVVLGPPQVVENGILGHDEETGSWSIGPIEEREDVCMDPLLERESGSVGPIDVLEDDIFFPDEVIESGFMLMGTDEERESGLSDANEKRENMVMDVREEGESGLMGEPSEGKSDDWSSSIGSCFDEVGCIQNEWLDCGWGGMWDPMMEGGEIVSSLWESDSGEGHLHGIIESEQEKFASWFLSTDTNVM